MLSSHNKTAKLIWGFVALSLVFIWGYSCNQAWAEDKKVTVKLVWEKEIPAIEKDVDFYQAAKNYFKVAESRILNPSAAEGKRAVVVYDKVLFLDGQDKIFKQITLRRDENLNPDTGEGIAQEAVISEDAQNAGVVTWGELRNSFTFYDVEGKVLWELNAEDGSTFRTAYIYNKEQKIILIKEPTESSPNPYTIVFLNKDGEILKEYKKENFRIVPLRINFDNFGNIDILWAQGKTMIVTRLDISGNLLLEKDLTGFQQGLHVSPSGKYYGAQKKEGDYYYFYIYDQQDNLVKKIQVEYGAGFSKLGDYAQIYTGTGEQIIDLNTGLPIWSFDSRSIPGEEPNNVERLSTKISRDGNFILYSLARKDKGKPSWAILLDKNKKKLWQETFSQCGNQSEFSDDENFIRVYLGCNQIKLYKIE